MVQYDKAALREAIVDFCVAAAEADGDGGLADGAGLPSGPGYQVNYGPQ